jgi:hypothetical protein
LVFFRVFVFRAFVIRISGEMKMSWPLSQDYNEAIQSPTVNFTDADLKKGEAVTSALGLPMPFSGNFADVYQVRCPDGSRWAVKCFTREVSGLRERYQKISDHLEQTKLPFTVDFTYLEKGICVAGKWYPVLKMQWVEGLMLNQFVGKYLDKPAMLEALCQIWTRMATRLRAADVAHGDLQHGNILLVPGAGANSLALKLIDYDGMWTPALAKVKSGEVGHGNYQHPQRLREGTYNAEVDCFPLLLIATALRALTVKGKALWEKYDNGDNLLFKESDLRDPAKSELFRELAQMGDPRTAALTARMRKALTSGLESTPLLDEALPETPALPKRLSRLAPTAAAVKTKTKKSGAPVGLLVAAAVGLVVVLGGAAGAFFLTRGSGPEKPPAKPPAELAVVQSQQIDDSEKEPIKPVGDNNVAPSFVEEPRPTLKEEPAPLPSEPEQPAKAVPEKWEGLDLGSAMDRDGVIRIPPRSIVSTKETYSGPIEIAVIARIRGNDIRLRAFNGACVIFNWDSNRGELRVSRPDGNDKPESGSLATAGVRPLDPNTWYTLRWVITAEGMQVFVDGKVIFTESKRYDLSAKRPVTISNFNDIVEVKSFEVKHVVPEPKPAAPDAAALAAADKEFKDVHKAEFAKRKPAELQALAAKLLQEGIDTKDKPAVRFALLRGARDLAAKVGDLSLSLRAAGEMAERFDVDEQEMKLQAVETGARAATTRGANLHVAEAALPLAEEALDGDDFDKAKRFIQIALDTSKGADNPSVRAAVDERLGEIEALRKAYEPVKAALQTLAGKPDDAAANLTLGTYLALAKGDWNRGLPSLAQGSDPKLRALAAADLSCASDPEAQVEMAKKYLEQVEGESGAAKAHLQRRACYWYQRAEAKLTGISKAEATKKIADIAKLLPHQHPAIVCAYYGTGYDWQEVTDRVRGLLLPAKGHKESVRADAGELGIPNHDNHQAKTLAVVYQLGGQTCLSVTQEGGTAAIPAAAGAQDTDALWPAPGQELLVLAGRYGAEGTWANVTTQVQHVVKGPSLSVVANDDLIGDPIRNKEKTLLIVYRYNNRVRFATASQTQTAVLGAAPAKP